MAFQSLDYERISWWLSNLWIMSVSHDGFPISGLWAYLMMAFQSLNYERISWWLSNLWTMSVSHDGFPISGLWKYLMITFQSLDYERISWWLSNFWTMSVSHDGFPISRQWAYPMMAFQSLSCERISWRCFSIVYTKSNINVLINDLSCFSYRTDHNGNCLRLSSCFMLILIMVWVLFVCWFLVL
jgi:hypothetical protein